MVCPVAFRVVTSKSHCLKPVDFTVIKGSIPIKENDLSIDETALSQGELYTVVTNKQAKGKKGALVAILAGTKVEPIVEQLFKIPSSQRNKVKEITLDMANSIKLIAKKCFPQAVQVTDRFYVQELATAALQNLRIKHRWEAIDHENEQLQKAFNTVANSSS